MISGHAVCYNCNKVTEYCLMKPRGVPGFGRKCNGCASKFVCASGKPEVVIGIWIGH